MIIMAKFQKRLRKLVTPQSNAVVIGQGFGYLLDIAELFDTVFVFSWDLPKIKNKNLVYRENFADLNPLSEISTVFIDLDQIQHLQALLPVWLKWKSVILIEGNDVIGREHSKPLYDNHYRAVEQQGTHHIWKLKQ
jgi:hypothetical protein